MGRPASFARADLARALDDARLRGLRLLHVAIPAGPVLFLVVVALLAADPPQGSSYPGLPLLLSLVDAALFAGSWSAASLLYRGLLDRRLAGAASAREAVAALQQASVLRLAVLEGAALFGVVVLLVAALDGSLATGLFLWLNALPAGALVAFAAVRWPDRERLVDELAAPRPR